ncbi:MAG: FAD-binding oxidoreductase [Rhodospirillaceae bacterium TMED8]|nr:FAD-binding oxidoreductase [Magnetovibrio sp.]OUT47779.1 MAG: FAD-binding oxidoreductase [Rhodospirillaceae bacterium TMED8]
MSSSRPRLTGSGRIGESRLMQRLVSSIEGEVHFDPFTRGRYSTDASHYQIEPIGVVIPKTEDDIRVVVDLAKNEGIGLLPRGGGTSQCGQTVGEALVVDCTKHLNKIKSFDLESRHVLVEPGLVLDHLNAYLKPHGLWFPVDVSTSSRATLGGMAGNNSCGARSIVYGTMRDNVHAIKAVLPDSSVMTFGEVSDNASLAHLSKYQSGLVSEVLDIGRRRMGTIRANFPDVMRRVGGYNVDALIPGGAPRGDWVKGTIGQPQTHPNLAHLLVGSEGTLAFSTGLELELKPLPEHKVLGICHFPTFYEAMASTQYIVELGPSAVELVDRTMINLARDIPMFKTSVDRFVKGEPDALLLVEFAGDEPNTQRKKLADLVCLMADMGFANGVVEASDLNFQKDVWEVRKSGLNIMMSMKTEGKPISFIEDCAVRLEDLADYTARLTEVFDKHDTKGTWYAHASVGCLHVRPVLNLKTDLDTRKMRVIAEAAFEIVREYKGSHSGEHGDGLVRSEFHEAMFGSAMIDTFREVKAQFDVAGIMNPGKIVDPPKMDDRALFRYKPGYEAHMPDTALDWSEWGGFSDAIEMCNNNGACRKRDGGVMCPSYRITKDEQHVTRGRANTLRLAISGQLGPEAFTSDSMAETMRLCIGCKGCKRECPTGVDMTRMKTEFLYHFGQRHGMRIFDRLVAFLPLYAPWASKFGWFLNLRDRLPGLAKLSEILTGFSAQRKLPAWSLVPFNSNSLASKTEHGPEVVLWADTFTTWFEPENARSAVAVLEAGGYRVHLANDRRSSRPLCCGRTFLAAGLVDQARKEALRTVDALLPFVERGVPIVGLEPSCLLTMRDEFSALIPRDAARKLSDQALLFEEFLTRESEAKRLKLNLKPLPERKALLHGHCHQKAFGVMGAVEESLSLIPNLKIETIESSCCGMAGAFGYDVDNFENSMRMAELSLLPVVRAADAESLIVADGTSCRHQIYDGTARKAVHVAAVLERALVNREVK